MKELTKRISYLINDNLLHSNQFYRDEINCLKQAGFDVLIVSKDKNCTTSQREAIEEEEKNFNLTAITKRVAILKHIFCFFRMPRIYIGVLFYALKFGGGNLKRISEQKHNFGQAVLIGSWMREANISHLHTQLELPLSMTALLIKKIFGISFSLSAEADKFGEIHSDVLTEKISEADFFCCESSFTKSLLMRVSPPKEWNKFEVTLPGIDSEIYSPHRLREKPSLYQIVCVGQLIPSNGQKVLLSAVGELLKRKIRVAVRLVGDGPDRKLLEKFAAESNLSEYVFFEEMPEHSRLPDLYRNADICVFPGFAGNISLDLLRAMAAQLPCITTFINCNPEIIRHQTNGILVTPGDEAELALAIENLIAFPKLQRSLGTAGRKRVLEKYNLKSNLLYKSEIFQNRLKEIESESIYEKNAEPETRPIFETM